MPIEISCNSCNKRLRVPDNAAGKRVKCPQCQTVLSVPATGAASSPAPAPVAATKSTPTPSKSAPVPGKTAAVEKYHLKTEDGQTFGPVPKKELDSWFAEGRITAECQLLKDGADQWQWATDIYPQLSGESEENGGAAGGFPNFDAPASSAAASDNPFNFASKSSGSVSARGGGARSGTSSKLSARSGRRGSTNKSVAAPAIALMIVGALGLLGSFYNIFTALMSEPVIDPNTPEVVQEIIRNSRGPVAIVVQCLFIIVNLVIITGAFFMSRMQSWGMSLTSTILAMVNFGTCCCVLGLPIGIWSLVILLRPEIKAAFAESSRR